MAKSLTAGMPSGSDIAPKYTLRLAALDPSTGNAVSGVNVGTVVITANAVDTSVTPGVTYGDWFLVPGPGA